MDMVARPVNLQASRDIVIRFRGDLLDQPYLTLFTKPPGSRAEHAAGDDMTFRLLTYNILHGGGDRVAAIAEVIKGLRARPGVAPGGDQSTERPRASPSCPA